jgi:hypothetical protein
MIGLIAFSSWCAIAGPILVVTGGIGKMIAAKINAVGEHLKRQDDAKAVMSERISRLEGTVYRALKDADTSSPNRPEVA